MAAVGAVGLGIAILQARTILTSIKDRINNYRKGPETCRTVINNLDSLENRIGEVEEVLKNFPKAVPADISKSFNGAFSAVKENLEESRLIMELSLGATFGAGSSSVIGWVKSKSKRTFRAEKLRNAMDEVNTKIKDASDNLLRLIGILASVVKIQEDVLPKLENLAVVETAEDEFRPVSNAPDFSPSIKLDFDATNAEGKPENLEGKFKQSVLLSETSSGVTAAVGVMKPAFSIAGMAGVGKTVALIGLAHDKDIKARFPDGVLFMTLGRDATLQKVRGKIAKLLVKTGARKIATSVEKCADLQDAVDLASPWFKERTCLFLVDDVWPTTHCKTGFLPDLRQLLRESPDSRMAISTRSTEIARSAGTTVMFGARDPCGSVSMNMFMGHARGGVDGGISTELGPEVRSSVLKILSMCAGLPIAFAVTGSAVALLSNEYGNFGKACESYAKRLAEKRIILGVEEPSEGTCLNVLIRLSLEFLDVEFGKWKSKYSQAIRHSISDLYTSLCVLERQARVSLPVLGRLWCLDEDATTAVVNLFCGMSLAARHLHQTTSGSSEEDCIVLHDLHLDFCRLQATEADKLSGWHAQMLNGYLATENLSIAEEPDSQVITGFTPRPWWSKAVPDDDYIHSNVSRHLACAGHGTELAALLLDGRWIECRRKIGGILGLESDFEELKIILKQWENSSDIRLGFDRIFRAVQLSWFRLVEGSRFFLFHVCEHLASLSMSNAIVHAFVQRMEKYAPKPFLLPVNSFISELGTSLLMEIPTGGPCFSVVRSPCGRYFAAGSRFDIVVAKSTTGEILKRLHGHTHFVRCIVFNAGSKTIVSGSFDEKVMVWHWEASESPVQVFEGHGGPVHGVAVSGDGEWIFSGSSDETLRIWNTVAGEQASALPQGNVVSCVALSADGREIAIGLDGGTLKILDISTHDVIFEDSEAHQHGVSCVSFSSNGSLLATGSRDKTVCVRNTRTWRESRLCLRGHNSAVNCIAFSPDCKRIASCSDDGTIRLWDVESGTCVGDSPSIASEIKSVSFIGDGGRIVSGSFDDIVRIWDTGLGSCDGDARKISSEVEGKGFLIAAIFRAQQSLTTMSKYGHSDWVWGVAISKNGQQVASASADRTVRLWDAQTGQQMGVPMEGHTGSVACVSFSPDGRRVVSGSRDKTLRLWDTKTQSQIGLPFEGHTSSVHSVSFSFDGLRIVSGSWDCTVRIWNVETHEQIGEALLGNAKISVCVSESADGSHIVTRDWCRTVIWNREHRTIVWDSEKVERNSENDATDDERNSDDVWNENAFENEIAEDEAENSKKVELNSEIDPTDDDRNSDDVSNNGNVFENEIAENEAEKIIRSCGQQTPSLWPKSFPAYAAELYKDGSSIYSNLSGEQTLLAGCDCMHWAYDSETKLVACGFPTGAVGICKLRT